MRRMSFTQELEALATASEGMEAGDCWLALAPAGTISTRLLAVFPSVKGHGRTHIVSDYGARTIC